MGDDGGAPLVGLTGGLGAGKTTALRALEELGAAVISADEVVHVLYEEPEVRRAVVERWGPEVAPGVRVVRAAIAARVFADSEERRWLEGLLWPRVGERIEAWVKEARARRPAPRAVVVETPLLFEAGLDGAYDATIAVSAPEELRAGRAGARGHALAEERAASQLSQEEKVRRATYAVSNDGSPGLLRERLADVLERIERDRGGG